MGDNLFERSLKKVGKVLEVDGGEMSHNVVKFLKIFFIIFNYAYVCTCGYMPVNAGA